MFGMTSHSKAGKKGGMIGAPVGSPPRSKANSAAASGMASVHGDTMSEAREAQLAAWHESQLKLYQQIMGIPDEKVTISSCTAFASRASKTHMNSFPFLHDLSSRRQNPRDAK